MEATSVARVRWKLLSDFVLNRKTLTEAEVSGISVRRHKGFSLFKRRSIHNDVEECTFKEDKILITKSEQKNEVKDLMGFDTTGLVCLWPSEEILAYYCLQHKDIFQGKTVCELGAGKTGLAALCIAFCANSLSVLITDGNDVACDCISECIELNKKNTSKEVNVSSRQLVWKKNQQMATELVDKFDFIVAADCLFRKEFHEDLLYVMQQLLRESGRVILFAPSRGSTLQQFTLKAQASGFNTQIVENYDEYIWKQHQEFLTTEEKLYDPALHYPLLLLLSKQK